MERSGPADCVVLPTHFSASKVLLGHFLREVTLLRKGILVRRVVYILLIFVFDVGRGSRFLYDWLILKESRPFIGYTLLFHGLRLNLRQGIRKSCPFSDHFSKEIVVSKKRNAV